MTTAQTTKPTVSVNDVKAGRLDPTITGVHWTDTSWTECRDHLDDPSWSSTVDPADEPVGVALYGEVDCDLCRESALWDPTE